ncbi:pyridoxal phosphate-dependent aminotransferase [Eudoraea chungangensis]|uniref:pyridoxal phosphate-dependent aminotransferase n=1 Tax=Eudoraea chungangensis TaxID=1481905 RepID=UPI0023EB00F6|nr:aminotransferase class I/II-fold pyridoxal phosphate-dependent enzyme [Eudoraea chungangensis]
MIEKAKRLQTVEEYYFSKKLREVRALVQAGKPVINMGIGSPDLPPSEEVISALKSSLHDPKAHQYQSYQGLPELREAIVEFYKTQFEVSLDAAAEVLPLMGSKEGIMHISLAFLNPGDEVLIPNPGYPTYTSVSKLVGAKIREYNLLESNAWLPDLSALEKQDLSKVKLMWTSYPHMPTGATADLKDLRKLVEFAEKHNILLVNDNPYSFVLCENPTSLLSIAAAKNSVLELNSLSKTFNMAGWRVGMVLGGADNINAILKVKSNMDSGMFYGIQKGAIAALNSAENWYNSLNELYKSRRNKMFHLADLLGCSYDKEAAGMFVWAKLPEAKEGSEQFIDRILKEKDIFIAPGTIFGTNGEGYIRFSLCVSEEKIEEAIKRFAN